MKRKTTSRRLLERELVYYLELYNELKGRHGVEQTLVFIDIEIYKLVELLKQM